MSNDKRPYYFIEQFFGNRVYNRLLNRYLRLKTKRYKNELYHRITENKKMYNLHQGERCFILGNGPSINQQDLSLLANETVFTCNQISRNNNYKILKSNYHFWADPIFFNIKREKPEDMELLDTMKKIKTKDNNPKCFFPTIAYEMIKEHNLDEYLDISFYQSGLLMNENFKGDIDFSSVVPSMHTVVQYQVLLAIYMGFREIYLLGSEFTGILTSINIRLKHNLNQDYAYDITVNEEKRMRSRVDFITFEEELYSFYSVLRDYRIINDYCMKKKINLYNCTPGGLIESIPRIKYEDIFSD